MRNEVNMKIAQWVRNKLNEIFKLEAFHIEMHFMVEKNYFIKVADTPQELIQAGDAVEIKGYKDTITVVITEVCGDVLYTRGTGYELEFHIDNVVAILTPNEDKSIYTEQWKVEE